MDASFHLRLTFNLSVNCMIAENRAVVNPVFKLIEKNQYFTAEGIFSAIQVVPSVVRWTRFGTVYA